MLKNAKIACKILIALLLLDSLICFILTFVFGLVFLIPAFSQLVAIPLILVYYKVFDICEYIKNTSEYKKYKEQKFANKKQVKVSYQKVAISKEISCYDCKHYNENLTSGCPFFTNEINHHILSGHSTCGKREPK